MNRDDDDAGGDAGAQEHRYPRAALKGDYVRAGVGLVLTGGPLMVTGVALIPALILGSLASLFGYFGLRTYLRQRTVLTLDEDGLSMRALRRTRLRWEALDSVKLRYYSTRRDRTSGWLQLTLRGGRARIAVDSTLPGFDGIAERAYHAARARRIKIAGATAENFTALGIIGRPEDAT